MEKKVLITGVGGNVGQGVLRNIKKTSYDIDIIGTNTEAISAGNYFCDKVYKVPFSTESSYLSCIEEICDKENVNLIIPTTDYETYYLSTIKDKLPDIVVSDKDVTNIFLDKYETFLSFKKYSIPFAESYLPSQYKGEFDAVIVKPRKGRGSRNVIDNPSTTSTFPDEFVVQKKYIGNEITTAFYVTRAKKMIGYITMKRTLLHGYTNQCEVVDEYNYEINNIIDNITKCFNIVGPCNIQSIVDSRGNIIPFEINCRISGTNSIRSEFGFEDVKYILDEYLYGKTIDPPIVRKGAAVRIVMDIVYPGCLFEDITSSNKKGYIC